MRGSVILIQADGISKSEKILSPFCFFKNMYVLGIPLDLIFSRCVCVAIVFVCLTHLVDQTERSLILVAPTPSLQRPLLGFHFG